MRSVPLLAPRLLEVREIPMPPDPGPGEVLVRLRAVGICGSDLHWFREGGCLGAWATFPHLLGHEPAGEIVAVGPGVEGLLPGRRIVLEPAITCGHCEYCLAGRHNLCASVRMAGTPKLPGYLREYALLPAGNAVPIPESMSFVEASLIEPVTIALHALQLAPVRLGDTVAVTGAGPIGLLVAAVARLAGASRIFITDRVAHRLELAREMGVDSAVDIRSFESCIKDQTGGRGVDVVFEAAGGIETLNAALAVARPGGSVLFIGIPEIAPFPLEIYPAIVKELTIRAQRRANHNTHAALELLASGRIDDRMVTHRMPLEETPLAFEIAAAYADQVGKIVIEIGQ
ncbi:MAG: alcohol dehydrogenase catalytic domain-containing protein [Bryobacterales bacterium]|nr:alcohol dehydrogenase catalytic domain-containing protein [Bryobacterales bacterium]